MKTQSWLYYSLLVLLIMFCTTSRWNAPPALAAQGTVPFFEPAPCMFELPFGVIPDYVECGYLVVPETHQNPDGPTIRLGVAVIRSTHPNPASDPLVLLQGGPGGSTIDTFVEILAFQNPLTPRRDIILFDQRGTLYAEPALRCPEVLDMTIDTLDQELSDAEADRLFQEAMQACRTRLVADGIDLSAYDSLENAADVEALRVALGYDQINLYGVSYGTTLALHVMRTYPQGLRSVILDAVAPPDINFLETVARSQDRAFTRLFETCAADPACSAAYPDLEQLFFDLVEQLNEEPDRMRLTDSETGMTYDALLDGDTLQEGLFQMLYVSDILPALPRIIYDAREGRYDVLERILSLVVFDRSLSYGMYFSVVCAEDADFSPADLPLEDVHPSIAEGAADDAASLLQTCALWDVVPLGPPIDQPVVSDVPTLVLSGNFDPITPPAFGQAAAETLTRSYVYTFPNVGHGAALAGECPNQIIRDFLRDPTTPPDAACIERLGPPDYITSDMLLPLPSLLRLANLEGNSTAQLLAFSLSLLFLLSIMLVWPLVWLIRLVRRRPAEPLPLPVRTLPWLAALNGVLLTGFTLVLLILLITTAEEVGTLLLFGAPRSWAPLFVLPLLSALLTLIMLAGSLLTWFRHNWPLWRRSYFSLVTLAALVCVALLGVWGMLSVFV